MSVYPLGGAREWGRCQRAACPVVNPGSCGNSSRRARSTAALAAGASGHANADSRHHAHVSVSAACSSKAPRGASACAWATARQSQPDSTPNRCAAISARAHALPTAAQAVAHTSSHNSHRTRSDTERDAMVPDE